MKNKLSPNPYKKKLNTQQNIPPILNPVSSDDMRIQNPNMISSSTLPYLNEYTPRTQIPKQLDNNYMSSSDKQKGKSSGITIVQKIVSKKKQQIDLKAQLTRMKLELQIAKKNQRELAQSKNEVIKLKKENNILRQQLKMKQNQFKKIQTQKIKSIQIMYQQKIKQNVRAKNIISKQKEILQTLFAELENKLKIKCNQNMKLKEKIHSQSQFLKRIEYLQDIYNKIQKQVQKGDQQWQKQKPNTVKTKQKQEFYESILLE